MSYVSNIASSILGHAESVSVLGPEIYTAIAEWEKREIPVAIVLISIGEVWNYEKESFIGQVPVELVEAAVVRNFRAWLAHGGDAGGDGCSTGRFFLVDRRKSTQVLD